MDRRMTVLIVDDDPEILTQLRWALQDEFDLLVAVDSVVRTRVEKTRYLSNAASLGLDVGYSVLEELTDGDLGWLLPSGITRKLAKKFPYRS